MKIIFELLEQIILVNPSILLAISFLWGILSILISPCHITGLSMSILSLKNSSSYKHQLSLFMTGLVFSFIIFLVFTILFKSLMLSLSLPSDLIYAVLILQSGMMLLGLVDIKFPRLSTPNFSQRSIPFFAGFLFGLFTGPCTLAFAMPVISAAGSLDQAIGWHLVSIVASFSIGNLVAMVLVARSIGFITAWLGERSLIRKIKICSGLGLVGFSFLMFYKFGQTF
jgi:cytochrome c-type biogenesis protein